MSRVVDSKVVEMQFDNSKFEKNVSTSMSTIEKLKQKLNFKGATKGLEDTSKGFYSLNSAAKSVNMNSLASSIDKVQAKFSAMQVMGVTALANITNSAVNAGKNIVSALTIDPIKTGLQEYETQINATQTILANTSNQGTTLEDVNKALNELNKYADLTIYNFTEMTKNIGTFTAAGLDLDTSVKGIQGIANLAAISGSTSQQASTAMYQLSQALANGTVNLQDWNSVVNAGMGGKVFQDAIMQTAKDIKGTDAAVSAAIKKYESGSNFRSILNAQDNEAWFSSDILTATLSKFTKTGAVEYLSDLYKVSSKNITELQKLGDTTGYNSKEFDKMVQSLSKGDKAMADNIKGVLSMANTATNAATEVKTLSQLWSTLKETAQSGWTKTWELIIGDFDQSKKLFTSLYNFFSGIIEKISTARNKLIGGAMKNPFSTMLDKIHGSSIGKTVEKVNNLSKSLEYYQKVVTDVWRGDYKNQPYRYDLLDKAGHNHKVIQDLVNKGYQYKITMKDVEESEKKFGVSLTETSKSAKKTSESIKTLTDKQLKNAGLTKEEINLYRELEEQSKKTGKSIDQIVKDMENQDGRTLLIESFKNAGKGLISIITSIKDAWFEVFPPMTVMQLYNIIKGLNDFSKNLIVSKKTADNLRRTMKGLFAILDIVLTIVGGPIKIAFKALTQLLGMFNLNILDVTARIGDVIVKFRDWMDKTIDFTGIFEVLLPYIKDAGKSIKKWFNGLKESEAIKKLTDYLSNASESFKKWIEGFKDAESIPKYIISGLVNGLKSGATAIFNAAVAFAKLIIDTVKSVLGIESPSKVFIAIGAFIVAGLIIGITKGFPKVFDKIKEYGGDTLSNFVDGLQNGASTVWNFLKGFGSKIVKFIKNIDFGSVLIMAFAGGLMFAIIKISKAIESFGALAKGLGNMFENFGTGVNNLLTGIGASFKAKELETKSKAILNFAIAIGILAASIFVLSRIESKDLWEAVGAVAALAAIIGGLVFAVSKFKSTDSMQVAAFALVIYTLGSALIKLSIAMKILSTMSWDELKVASSGLLALGAFITVFMVIAKKSESVLQIGKTLLAIAGAMTILAIVIKILGSMSWPKLGKAGAAMAGLTVVVGILLAISKKAGPDVAKINSTFLHIAGAIAILAIVAKLLGSMSWPQLGKAGAAMAGLTVVVGILLAISKKAGSDAHKIGETLIAISGAIAILSIVAKLLGNMSWPQLGKAGAGILGIGVVIWGLVNIVKKVDQDAPKIGKTLIAISGAMAILAIVAKLLGSMNWPQLGKAGAGLLGLTIIVGYLVNIVKKVGGDAPKISKTLIAISGAIAILATITVMLGLVKFWNLVQGVLAVGILGGLVDAILHAAKNSEKAFKSLIAMSVLIGVLGQVLYLLSNIDSSANILDSALAIGTILLALMVTLDVVNKTGGGASTGGGLLLAAAGILAIAAALKVLSTIPADSVATSIILLVSALGALIGIAAGFSFFAAGASLAVGVLLSLAAVIVAVGVAAIAFAGALYIAGLALPSLADGLVILITSLAGCSDKAFGFFKMLLTIAAALVVVAAPLVIISSAITVLGLALGIAGIVAIGFIAALGLLSLILPTLAEGIKVFIEKLADCSGRSDEFWKTMSVLSGGLLKIGAALIVAGVGVAILSSGLLVVSAALLVVSISALVFVAALALLGASLPMISTGLTELGEGLNNFITSVGMCKDTIDNFKTVMSELGTSILGFILKIAVGLNALGLSAITAGAGALVLAVGVVALGSAVLYGSTCVLALALAFYVLGEALDVTVQAAEAGKNLVLGFALGIWNSIRVAIETVKSFCGRVVNSIKNFLGIHSPSEVMKELGINTGEGFKLGLDESSSGVEESAKSLAKKTKDGLSQAGSEGGTGFKTGLSDNLDLNSLDLGSINTESIKNMFSSAGSEGGSSFKSALGDNLDFSSLDMGSLDTESINNMFSSAGSEGGDSFKSALGSNLDFGSLDMGSLDTKSINKEFGSAGSDGGTTFVKKVGSGIDSGKDNLMKKIKALATSAAFAIKTKKEDFASAGKYLGAGLIEGIYATWDAVYKAGYALGQAAVKGEKDGQASDSPSKLTIKAGKWLGQGLVIGMEKMNKVVYKAGYGLGDTATSTISSAISRISDYVNSDIDAQPTIRPVLDLSDVANGANSINRLFNANPSVGLLSNINSISSSMNKRQNRNSEIVDAVNSLNDTMTNIKPGNSYNINGITYDDGSNVAKAIETLIRATKIERRV